VTLIDSFREFLRFLVIKLTYSIISLAHKRINTNQVIEEASIIDKQWLFLRLELLENLVIFFATLFSVIGHGSLKPGEIGLALY
jgi:hypothetical protein